MNAGGHCVLVTGASRGIGLALARKFHSEGNRVVLVGRDAKALEQAAESMPGAVVRVADLQDAGQCAQLAAAFPDVNVLVNNAGIQCNGRFADLTAEDVQREIAINLTAPLLLTHAFLPVLVRHPCAAAVNVTSALALVPKESASVYCATKAALRSHTRTLRWQLEGGPVRVFELVPPLVETAMTTGRGSGKITPGDLADEFWKAFVADQFETRAGKAKALALLARWVPALAERIIRKG